MATPREPLSARAAAGKPSMTLAITAKAKAMKAEGKDVVSFAAGEPDFKTPGHICEAAKKAIDDGLHGYTPNPGMPKLKEAVCQRHERELGLTYTPAEILVSPGAKFSLYLAMQAMLDPGDEVLLPAPYWVSYPEQVRLAGASVVTIPTSEANGFAFTAEDLLKAVTPKTKLLILNSPSNPSGGVVPPLEIEKIGRVLEEKGLWCVSDEIYDKLVYGDAAHRSVATVSDYCREHTIVVNGCSKAYAMTGWRIGVSAGPAAVIKAMASWQSQSTSNACAIAQAAAIAAFTGPQEPVESMRAEFEKRRDLIVRLLNGIDGVSCATPGGAFYVLPNVSGVFGRSPKGRSLASPMDVCTAALEEVLVAPVPGEAFGSQEHIRMSYATSPDQIEEGCRRLKDFLES